MNNIVEDEKKYWPERSGNEGNISRCTLKSYKHHMVGGEGLLPCCVTLDSSTEPLVNNHPWLREVVRK